MVRPTTILSLLATASLVQATVLPIPFADDEDDTPLPLIIWHGLGDNYAAEGLAQVAKLAEEANPGTLVYIIRVDDDASADRTATFFGNVTLQLEKVCADLAAHPILSTAPAVVTFGSQHNGISEFQTCGATDWLCKGAQGLLRSNTWSSFVQSRLVPAQYFRDPLQYDQYLEFSNFLADINNERELKNETYKRNLAKLERFVMYLFEDDETVIPKETGWFAEVNGTEITPLRERAIYKEDWLGLEALDKKGALEFKTTEGGHMTLSDKLLDKVFKDYYGPYGKSFEKKPEIKLQLEL
jgi:palmitoyl-protein thioesterase